MQDSLLGRTITGRSIPGYDLYSYEPTKTEYLSQSARALQSPGSGVPLTDEQRMAAHYARYGTTLPPRDTGLARQKLVEGEFPWGTLLVGGIIGFVFAAFVLTPTGRVVGAAAGERVARKVRG